MSSVRMCDKCNTVFSELEDGWQTFSATTVRRDDDGRSVNVQATMDACPSCAMIPPRQFRRELEATQEGNALQANIAKLERETGIATES